MSNSFVQFQTTLPVSLVLMGTLVFMVVFGWLEWKRKSRFLFFRLVALAVMVLAVAAFLLQPARLADNTSENMIVLTLHYTKTSVDSLHRAHPQYKMVAFPGAESYAGAGQGMSENEILNVAGQIRVVAGDGLPSYFLPLSAKFVKGQLPAGIVELRVPDKIQANRTYSVSGVWHGEPALLTLLSPGGKEDSVRVENNEHFTLNFKSGQAGKYIYTITIRAGDKLWEEKLPIEVHEPNPLRILVWQQYPSAETRYLKNFLIEQGHQVVVRTQISKTNFRLEYGNHAQVPVNRITTDLLNEFDLLVLANEANPTATEISSIEYAAQQGLGVLWQPAEADFSKPPFGFKFTKIESDTAHIKQDGVVSVFPVWPVVSGERVVPVIANSQGAWVGYKNKGAGKIGYNLITETYPLIVKERTEMYASMWTQIIESLVRTVNASTVIQIENSFPVYVQEPVTLSVISMQDEPKIISDSVTVPLREHLVIDKYWKATTWPMQAGWHQVFSPADSVRLNFYVFEVGEWEALRAANLHRINQLGITNNSSAVSSTENMTYQLINPIWFFVLFVLAAGFLWLAPKL